MTWRPTYSPDGRRKASGTVPMTVKPSDSHRRTAAVLVSTTALNWIARKPLRRCQSTTYSASARPTPLPRASAPTMNDAVPTWAPWAGRLGPIFALPRRVPPWRAVTRWSPVQNSRASASAMSLGIAYVSPARATSWRIGRNSGQSSSSKVRMSIRSVTGGSTAGVIRCLDRHLHVVRVRLLEAGRGDPDELALVLELGDGAGADVEHRLVQPAHELVGNR